MPIRNLWSLEPGECIVAEELLKRGFEVYFPVHDVGVDLLIVKEEKHFGIQVKESRYYYSRRWRSGHVGHSWHQIKKEKLLKSRADFRVFLTYIPAEAEHKTSRFENKFLVVPSAELRRRISVKDPGEAQTYSFCFHFEDNRVWDERIAVPHNGLTTYDQFIDAWSLIK
ncbi:hypothetical protein KEJ47_09635 [Candidatus Bathyarchaeota archaeon]|nr:hypothetical protein [Candidatus Bathyarchaeota archaeon]